jgi:hypothetical protein
VSDLESRLRAALHDETAPLSARPDLADDMVSRGMAVRRRRRAVGGMAAVVVVAAAFPVWRSIDTSSGPTPVTSSPTGHLVTHTSPTTPSSPPTPTTPTTTSTTSSTAPTTGPDQVWSVAPVEITHLLRRPTQVVGLRVAEHDTYDRVVIDFAGELPSYQVRYVPALTYDGSGAPVPLEGQRFLQLSLPMASAHDDQGHSVYGGPQLAPYTFPTLVGVAFLGDYEGTVSFGLAVNRHAGFHVSTLPSPTRLIIDLHH